MNITGNNPHNFTDEQYKAYAEILDSCHSFGGKVHLIKGVAGTGKTYLTTKIVTELKKHKVLCCAPTHKAVKVLQTQAGINYQNVTFTTIHSALGLREKIDGHGVQSFEVDKTIQKKIDKAEYMIIDEVSMIHDDLFDMLIKYVESNNLKIIMVGDPVQIPPIGKKDAKPFSELIQKKYAIKVSTLLTIVRQTIGHPIIEKSFEVRQRIGERNCFLSREDMISPVGSVYFKNQDNLQELFATYFDTMDFKRNIDHARVIAWTNAAVDEHNKLIRSIIYKRASLPKLVIGEKLIMDAPVVKKDKVILNTNDEVEVVGFKICKEEIKGLDKFVRYYDTVVKYETAFFGNIHHNIKIIHEDSENELDNIAEQVKQVALEELKLRGPEYARMYWIMYYHLKGYFAQVKYGYAITCHKSQGSTYTHAIIDEKNIRQNPDVVERNRILYTAITRCKRNCYILE